MKESIKKKILLSLKSLGLIFLLLYFATVVVIIFNINVDKLSDFEYMLLMVGSNLVFLALILFIFRDKLIEDGKKFFKHFEKNIDMPLRYWAIGFAIMVASNFILTFILKKPLAGNEEVVRNLIDKFPIYMIFNTIIYAPFTEELVFRKSIRDVISNKWVYAIVSGVVFGALHIIGYVNSVTDLLYLIPYSALGVSFALLYAKTDNIYSSISMHLLHNSLSVIVYLLR